MATVAEFTIGADEFPLGRIFEHVPGVKLELERVVPTSKAIMPYLWMRGAEVDNIKETLDDIPELEDIKLVDEIEHNRARVMTDYQLGLPRNSGFTVPAIPC